MPTAVLVDASFFLKRYPSIFPDADPLDAAEVAATLHRLSLAHRDQRQGSQSLYRIFVYDCPPAMKKLHLPISKLPFDAALSDTAKFRTAFHAELRRLRKVALRLGHLGGSNGWVLDARRADALVKRTITVADLSDADFRYDVRQKGVDMRVGLDIASLSYKRLVDQIVLIAGDADFVPAAKLARREGIDFVLDPMWANISVELREHIDGLRSTCAKPVA